MGNTIDADRRPEGFSQGDYVVIGDDNNHPPGRHVQRGEEQVPTPEIVELQKEVLKWKERYELAVRATGASDGHVRFLESLLDKNPAIVDYSKKVNELQQRVCDLTIELEEERIRASERIEELECKVAQYEKLLQKSHKSTAVDLSKKRKRGEETNDEEKVEEGKIKKHKNGNGRVLEDEKENDENTPDEMIDDWEERKSAGTMVSSNSEAVHDFRGPSGDERADEDYDKECHPSPPPPPPRPSMGDSSSNSCSLADLQQIPLPQARTPSTDTSSLSSFDLSPPGPPLLFPGLRKLLATPLPVLKAQYQQLQLDAHATAAATQQAYAPPPGFGQWGAQPEIFDGASSQHPQQAAGPEPLQLDQESVNKTLFAALGLSNKTLFAALGHSGDRAAKGSPFLPQHHHSSQPYE